MRTILIAIICIICAINAAESGEKKSAQHGMLHPDMFPVTMFEDQDFDENAPICSYREPCGFYSFSLYGRAGSPMRWVRSWCRCDEDHACKFDHIDVKKRMYRHFCHKKEEQEESDEQL